MNEKNLNKLITEALLIEEESAKEAGAIGYMARALVQATLPHSKKEGHTFKRSNGNFKLLMLSDPDTGLPYGSIPRLLLAWIVTEAVRTKEKELILGKSLSGFMEELDLVPTGGRWGSITRLKDQMRRFFSCSISCTYDDGARWSIQNISPVHKADLWWDPKSPDQTTFFNSTLTLHEDFFKEIISNPVPIDMRALKAIKKSPLALDIYCWLTYRLSYVNKKTVIPWEGLKNQFGEDYGRLIDFKRKFIGQLRAISVVYPEANLDENELGLVLLPSKPHIPFKE